MTYKINPVYYLNDADMYKGPINKYNIFCVQIFKNIVYCMLAVHGVQIEHAQHN